MTVASLSFALIRVFEGCKLAAYQDAGGVWTIGIGHTRTAKKGMVITEQQALDLYIEDAAPLLQMVQDRPLFEAAALVSFGFNCGAGALARLIRGEISLETYGRTAAGKVLPGLVARRELERALIAASKD